MSPSFARRPRGAALATLAVVAAVAVVVTAAAGRLGAQTVPAGFTDTLVVGSLSAPTSIAFVPDGRLLITTQGGALRVFCTNTTAPGCGSEGLLATPALTFGSSGFPAICSNSERGLLGVAVDPSFATNGTVYLFYTYNRFATCPTGAPTNPNVPVNRVSRFVLPASNVVAAASETVLVDNILSPNGNHNGGDLRFGRDGYLYVSTGDGGGDYAGNSGSGGANDAARDEFQLLGKILRIDRDGNIPPSNPFQGAGTARCSVAGSTTPGNRCQETFAWGLRNPFRFAMDPNAAGTRFFVNDVGQGSWEEIDEGQAGTDYGWNCREGRHTNSTGGPCSPTPAGMVDPLFEWQHGFSIPGTTSPTNCNSITGGAFVPSGVWPLEYEGAYLFSDYVCGGIFRLNQSGPSWNASDFASGLGASSGPTTLLFGPSGNTQALYYTRYNGGGQVRRIVYGTGDGSPFLFTTLTPCRVLDTRLPDDPLGGPALAANTIRSFPLTGVCDLPADARAVAANVTVTGASGSGTVTLYATGLTRPLASTISLTAGRTRANNTIVRLGSTGAVDVFAGLDGGATHLILDVVGYFR